MALLTIDVGTTVVKAAVVDRSGEVLGSAAVRTRDVSEGSGTAEIAATDLTQVPLDVLRETFLSSGLHSEEIEAIGVTGARGTVQAFDRNDAPLGNAVTWVDQRGRDELNEFVERLGGPDPVAALLGINANPVLSVATILRLRTDPDCPQHGAVRFAGSQATVIQRLTGKEACLERLSDEADGIAPGSDGRISCGSDQPLDVPTERS